jgi:outer membrane biosynthesis protein TonB
MLRLFVIRPVTVQRMTKKPLDSHRALFARRTPLHWVSLAAAMTSAFTVVLSGCATTSVEPPKTPVPAPVVTTSAATESRPPASPPVAEPAPAPAPLAPEPIAQPKEPPPVELPNYAKRGKRLPADGGAPGRAVANYCRSFEIDKDAATHFKTLTRTKRLPTPEDVAERSRQAGQALTVQQVVERDWALRRESNKSVPQRCKVLGGSIDGATALVVFEAELNGRRQRGIATVLQIDKTWRVRDHGDWARIK